MPFHLCDCWEHVLTGQDGCGLVGQVEPLQAGQREQRGGHHSLAQLPHPRLHVAAEVHHLQRTPPPLVRPLARNLGGAHMYSAMLSQHQSSESPEPQQHGGHKQVTKQVTVDSGPAVATSPGVSSITESSFTWLHRTL